MDDLNTLGRKFAHALAQAKAIARDRKDEQEKAEKIHVVGAGSVVTAAYEQLRNAAEYSEEHLLLQKAIRRFYRRLFLTRSAESISRSGSELITELTYAGYIPNDSVPEKTTESINKLVIEYFSVYQQIQSSRNVANVRAETWAVDVLSVELSWLFIDMHTKEALAQFAFDHFKQTTDFTVLFNGATPANLEPALYVAINKALLKFDPAIIRAALLRRYNQSTRDFAGYCSVNAEINTLLESDTTEKLTRFVDRQGAPLRIIARMLEEQGGVDELLSRKTRFLNAFESQVSSEYKSINKRINRGIFKSVVFLIITKALVGLAIEIPYDIMVHQTIIWLALIVNLLFPPIYMVLLRATLILPPGANTSKLVSQAETILYGNISQNLYRQPKDSFGAMYNILYALFMLVVFGGVTWLLMTYLQFEIPHVIVFFIFLSGASFLGFRLSRMIREIESVDSQQNGVTLVRDFLYMPFVVVGRWLSEKYAQVNFVSMILDMVIELPLKTILRLLRQWSAFISSKQDQL